MIRIAPARTADDLTEVRRLFQAYADFLAIDLEYQAFSAELAGLPGKYAPPEGELLLAWDGEGKAVGCVALRPLSTEGGCEMKRLYVSPQARGTGLGEALALAIEAAAVRIGYRMMMLDSLPRLEAAIALYRKLGFQPAEAYYPSPMAGTVFFQKALSGSA